MSGFFWPNSRYNDIPDNVFIGDRLKAFTRLQELGIALVRVAVGGVFLAHGAQKLLVFGIPSVAQVMGQMGIPFPALSAVAVTAAELLGGLGLLAGLFMRIAAMPIAFSMLVAVVSVHLKNGFFLPLGFEYALTLMLASVALSLTGPGAFSLDRLFPGRKATLDSMEMKGSA